MRHLKGVHWERFRRPNDSFDGRLFEQLIVRILNVHYGGGWHITKVSWDGGKDAVSEERRPGPTGEAISTISWAECKLHRQPISLKLISNTLVMAVIDQPQRLLLFSHSRVVDNAKLALAQFGSITGIAVEIIDDEVLEELLLRNMTECREAFFPSFPVSFAATALGDGLELIPRLTLSVDVDPARIGSDEPDIAQTSDVVSLRALMRLQLAVRNRHITNPADVSVMICGAEPKTSRFAETAPFELVTESRYLIQRVAPRGLAQFDFYFRPNIPGRRVALPILLVHDGQIPSEPVDLGYVEVRNLYLPTLIGGRFHKFIDDFREATTRRLRPVFTTIEGRSGVGKSRLSVEMTAALLANGREIHRFDANETHGGGFAGFARKLCAALYRLPDLASISVHEHGTSPTSAEQSKIGLERLLYDDSVDVAAHRDEVLELVQRGIGSRAVALVVDNVQYLDQTTIDFLASLVRRYDDVVAKLVCIFVFNTDMLVLNTRATVFRDELIARREIRRDSNLHFEVSDFDEREVDSFLDQLVSSDGRDEMSFTRRYPEFTQLLREKIVPRPLHLLQTMFYLADQHALERRDDFLLYVRDVELLHRALRETPSELKEILRMRWQRVVTDYPEIEESVRLLAVIRSINAEDADQLGVSESDRKMLVALGLARDERGRFVFFHEQVERCFAQFYAEMSETVASRLMRRIEDAQLDDTYLAAFVTLAAQSNLHDNALVKRAAQFLGDDLPCNDAHIAFGEHLRRLLWKHPDALAPEDELHAVRVLAALVSAERGLSYRTVVYDDEVARRKRRLSHFASAGEAFTRLLREHASWHFGTHQDARALELLLQAESMLERLTFPTIQVKERARADILNRLCVAYKSLADKETAAVMGSASLEIGERLGAPELVFLNHVDLGYLYYGSVPPSHELLSHWRTAVAHFEKHHAAIAAHGVDFASCANFIKGHVLLLEGKLEEAGALIDVWINRCMRSSDVYYGVGFMQLQILRHLLSPERDATLEMVTRLVDHTIDVVMRYDVSRAYWKALHARGRVEYMSGRQTSAMASYAMALDQLLDVSSRTNERLSLAFFEDMAIVAREARVALPSSASKIRDPEVYRRVFGIAALSDDEFDRFRADYRPCSTFSDGRMNLPCP